MSQLCFWEAGGLTYLYPCLRHRVPQALDKPGCSQVRGKVGLLCRAFLSPQDQRKGARASALLQTCALPKEELTCGVIYQNPLQWSKEPRTQLSRMR